ncbi:MAG: CPBP family intramembrane metalloprotease [Saprospiraceae bacterium]|nr:CPBP family intramembrane metalloprotease [Saprospiraceae bacterium]MCB9319566.1 CPBP family intramembrane metalloprotease [Lewinellaceae bacterium]
MTSKTNFYTYLGILISYTTISLVNWLFKTYNGAMLSNSQAVSKELIILGMVGVLFLIIRFGEKQGLGSIGLYPQNFGRSVLRALFIAVLSVAAVAVAIFICQAVGWSFGESHTFDQLSLWTVTLIVIRAGIAEEVFMRGFLLERLSTITGSKWVAAALSLIPFALLHYPGQGWAGVLVSFAAGGVLTWFYFWKRDLKANIVAHFLVDFIPNVAAQWFV